MNATHHILHVQQIFATRMVRSDNDSEAAEKIPLRSGAVENSTSGRGGRRAEIQTLVIMIGLLSPATLMIATSP